VFVRGASRLSTSRGALETERPRRGFTGAVPSIVKVLRLPAFEPGQRAVWPPWKVPLAVLMAQSMGAGVADDWRPKEETGRAQRVRQG
jgi:hypothetical protein